MNWGKGLTLFIIGFIAAMLGMVYIAFRQSNEMLEDNYYDREIKYQEVIDAKNRLKPYMNEFALSDSLSAIYLKLPNELSGHITEGNLSFIKLDNSKLDKQFAISQPLTKISKSELATGIYRIKLGWKNENTEYYYEDDMELKK